LLDIVFEVRDLIAQVTIGHNRSFPFQVNRTQFFTTDSCEDSVLSSW